MHWHTSFAPRQPWTKEKKKRKKLSLWAPHPCFVHLNDEENRKDMVTLIPVWSQSLSNGPSHEPRKVLILFLTSSEHKAKIFSSSERTFTVYTYPVLTDVTIMSAWSLDTILSDVSSPQIQLGVSNNSVAPARGGKQSCPFCGFHDFTL